MHSLHSFPCLQLPVDTQTPLLITEKRINDVIASSAESKIHLLSSFLFFLSHFNLESLKIAHQDV